MRSTPQHSTLPTYGIDDFVQALFRNLKIVVLVPLVILSLAALVILFAPRKYQSEAKLFMQVGRESVKLDPTATTGDTISMQSNNRDNEIVTAMEALKSRGTLEKVVERLGADVVLGRGGVGESQTNFLVNALRTCIGTAIQLVKSVDPVSEREQAIITMERNLDVSAENDSTLITVQFDAETPELAQIVAQELIDVYRDEHLRLHRTSGSKEFFTEQHDALKQKLDDSVNALRDARNAMNIVSIEARRGTLESRLADIESTLYGTLQQLASSKARVADIKKQLGTIPERMVGEELTVPNTGTDLLRQQVFELQVLMLDQQAKYNEDHPSLKIIRDQLKEAQERLKAESVARKEIKSDINPNHRTLKLSLAQEESQLAGFVAQNEKLREQRAEVLADMKRINDFELKIDQLSRESQLARNNYYRYAENLEKARIDEELDNNAISNAIEAQAATFAEKPVSPSVLLIGFLALMLSFFAVATLILLREQLGSKIYKVSQLEETLSLPVFGVLSDHNQELTTVA